MVYNIQLEQLVRYETSAACGVERTLVSNGTPS